MSKRFGNVLAVDRVSFDVAAGEFLTLLGPSGCGKTTTLRLIAGLESNDSGEILVGDRLVSSPERGISVAPEKRDIGMVFQSYAIWPHMTVFQNVSYPLRVRGKSRQEIETRVHQALGLVGLGGLEDRLATDLSGGQQQRVALARAIVFEPSVLLLDEPLSNLDAKLRAHMRVELKRLQHRTGITTIYVTHDQAESMALSDRIVVMNAARIEQVGDPRALYERPRTQFVADFVGSTNIVPGQVTELHADGSWCLVSTALGRPLARAPLSDPLPAVGEQVSLLVRPERVRLQREAPSEFAEAADGANQWMGVVDLGVYYGDRREYRVTVGEQELSVMTPADVDLERGQRVGIAIAPHDLVLLPSWEH